MKIGDKDFKTARPDNLDDQLVAPTGCNAAEIAQHLGGTPLANLIAAAVRPFLPDGAPSVPELAAAIGADGYDAALAQARALYAAKEPAPTKGSAANG